MTKSLALWALVVPIVACARATAVLPARSLFHARSLLHAPELLRPGDELVRKETKRDEDDVHIQACRDYLEFLLVKYCAERFDKKSVDSWSKFA